LDNLVLNCNFADDALFEQFRDYIMENISTQVLRKATLRIKIETL